MDILTRQLTKEERDSLLNVLFGFMLHDVGDGHLVLYDEEGHEFYGHAANCQFYFSTLAGFFSYQAHISKERGKINAQIAMRKALGL